MIKKKEYRDDDVIKITLVLENLEAITIDRKYIGGLLISDINQQIERTGLDSINKHTYCGDFFIEIFKDRNKDYYPFEIQDLEKITIFERLISHHDITQIYVTYGNGSEEQYIVDYKEENTKIGAPNLNESHYVSKNGHLYLLISSEITIDDYLDYDLIDAIDYCADNLYK